MAGGTRKKTLRVPFPRSVKSPQLTLKKKTIENNRKQSKTNENKLKPTKTRREQLTKPRQNGSLAQGLKAAVPDPMKCMAETPHSSAPYRGKSRKKTDLRFPSQSGRIVNHLKTCLQQIRMTTTNDNKLQ